MAPFRRVAAGCCLVGLAVQGLLVVAAQAQNGVTEHGATAVATPTPPPTLTHALDAEASAAMRVSDATATEGSWQQQLPAAAASTTAAADNMLEPASSSTAPPLPPLPPATSTHHARASSTAVVTGDNAFNRCYTYRATPDTSYEYADLVCTCDARRCILTHGCAHDHGCS